jgi:hypothetical protein
MKECNMKGKKRIISLSLIFIMTFLSACSSNSELTEETTTTTNGQEASGEMEGPPDGEMGAPPGGEEQGSTSKVSVTEGDWSFDVVTTISNDKETITSTITYYAGKTDAIVIVPSILGGAPVTEIAAQAFGHHSEIMAVYVPDSVAIVSEWAFYDLNTAVILSFANKEVVIDDAAFQSSGNAVLYLPEDTTQTNAGAKDVVSDNTVAVNVTIENASMAAIAGGNYLNVSNSEYGITADDIAAIAVSASKEESDVSYEKNTVTFSGDVYVVKEQVIEIYSDFVDVISEEELSKTFRALTASEAVSLNETIAADSSYSAVKSLLNFEEGYYINGNKVNLDESTVAYDVNTGESITADESTGMFPSTGYGYYKYVTYRDTDNDGDVDILYYSPYTVTYSYNSVNILSENENLNGLSARDILSTEYLSFANAVVKASDETENITKEELTADTSSDGEMLEASSNEERSILWADNYGTIQVDELHATSSSIGNWAKMSYEKGLNSYNVEIMMEWGMNALLYATNGGSITVGDNDGETSTFYANGDGANGIIAGGAGTSAGTNSASEETANVFVFNADFILEGWNNHVADVVYGGYAYLNNITSVTGIVGSYSVGQSSSIANDFGNGVIDVEDFHTTVYGNRSAGAYVIGGGVITAKDSSFVSKMDAGLVSASGGTFKIEDSTATGQIGFRNRGGINADSTSTLNNVTLTADKDLTAYVVGDKAEKAVAAWVKASGSSDFIHYMMSDTTMTIGKLCENYDISEEATNTLILELSEIAGDTYTKDTLVRNSVLDNTYYNYSAGQYTGTTDFSEVPYLTIGSAYGGLVSAVMDFEASGINLVLNNSKFENTNEEDYNYLLVSEAGSEPVIYFNSSDSEGIIWNEGDITRDVEGRSGERSSKLSVNFEDSDFTGSFADGSNGLWEVSGLSYTNQEGIATSLNGNYYGAQANWGITASFDENSSWTVTNDSYLGSLTIADGAKISAPNGYELKMTVNGTDTKITKGTYSGEIVITVVKK